MRILHIGFGFRPWITNGLVIYSEAVMDGQVRRGHDVGYFFPARQLPWLRRPFVHRWRRRGVQMFELVNSSLIVGRHRGTPVPWEELEHAVSEKAFGEVLTRFGPDLVHVHDLGGLPSSLLELSHRAGVKTVMSLHDYHLLCPTVKLYDAHDRICLRHDPGPMCAVCCADAPADNGDELARTLADARRRLRAVLPPVDAALRRPGAERIGVAGIRLMERAVGIHGAGRSTPGHGPTRAAPGPRALERPAPASPAAYQRRRDVNLERLGAVDALLAGSGRCAAIYRQLGLSGARIRILPLNPAHIDHLKPKRDRAPGEPLRFAVLNACSSTQKGAELIGDALARLSARGLDDRFRLAVHGPMPPQVQQRLATHPSVELHGSYSTDQLDDLLDPVDVGLFPSVWEEVYGFVGLEFLAKGIPVIGNAVGAIPEYVRPGQTGWLNRSCSGSELADLMASVVEDPSQVARLSATVAQARNELIAPFETGLAQLLDLYRELLAQRGPG